MDFSEMKLPEPGEQTEAERAYTRWYTQLPQERKARIFADMFQFGLDSVKYNAKKKNPFLTDAEATLRFIELHFKQDYSPEMFDFITKKMEERAEKEWKARFKAMKKALGWSHDDIAQFIGAENGNSIKSSLARKIPAFAKLAICVFEKSQKADV
ncbi:MAG: hypothetical protein ACKVU0_10485 [Saprospiraceae bacterium]